MMAENERLKWISSITRALEELKKKPEYIEVASDSTARGSSEAKRQPERY